MRLFRNTTSFSIFFWAATNPDVNEDVHWYKIIHYKLSFKAICEQSSYAKWGKNRCTLCVHAQSCSSVKLWKFKDRWLYENTFYLYKAVVILDTIYRQCNWDRKHHKTTKRLSWTKIFTWALFSTYLIMTTRTTLRVFLDRKVFNYWMD